MIHGVTIVCLSLWGNLLIRHVLLLEANLTQIKSNSGLVPNSLFWQSFVFSSCYANQITRPYLSDADVIQSCVALLKKRKERKPLKKATI